MGDLAIDFCGEWYEPSDEDVFDIGREGDLEVDDNPYLHRRFLQIARYDGIWWLSNVGSMLSATIADGSGGMQAWLARARGSRWSSATRTSFSRRAPPPTNSPST